MKRSYIKVTLLFLLLSPLAWAQTLQEGLTAIDYDKFELAKTIFTQLTQKEPASGINYYYLGVSNINLFKPAEAKEAFTKGTQAEPTHPANYAGLGRLLLNDGKKEEAKLQFDKALSFSRTKDGRYKDLNAIIYVADNMIAPENPMVDEAAQLIDVSIENPKLTYDFYITAGDVYLEKYPANAGKAASLYEKAISLEKSNPKAYVRVSFIWLRVKNADATKAELQRAIAIDSNYAPALKAQSEYYYQTRQFELAKKSYTRYLENSEPSIANKQRFARILFRSQDWGAAIYLINEIQAVDSSDVYLYRLAGYSYYEYGAEIKEKLEALPFFQKGIIALNTFIERAPKDKIVSNDYEYLGKLNARIPGNDGIATDYIAKALELDPNKTELYREAGDIYYKLKKFDEAVKYFESYISKTDKVTLVDYQKLGLSSYYSKQYLKCDSAYMKILELKPDYADGYYWRGTANASIDTDLKDTVAKYNYEKFVSLASATPEKSKSKLITAYDYLGGYAVQKDNNKLAKEYFEKIIALDPENQRAKDVLKQLK